MADMLVTGDTTAIRCVMLTRRINDRSLFVQDFPIHCYIGQFVQFQATRKLVASCTVSGPLLDLPKVSHHPSRRAFGTDELNAYSAEHMLKVLCMNRHLKSANTSEEAINDALEFSITDPAEIQHAKDNVSNVPDRSTIRRARLRLDAVSINVRRRHMQNLALNHGDEVVSAHLFTDGSPVTGVELQGMIRQMILISNLVIDIVMPGVRLAYGQTGVGSKVRTFL